MGLRRCYACGAEWCGMCRCVGCCVCRCEPGRVPERVPTCAPVCVRGCLIKHLSPHWCQQLAFSRVGHSACPERNREILTRTLSVTLSTNICISLRRRIRLCISCERWSEGSSVTTAVSTGGLRAGIWGCDGRGKWEYDERIDEWDVSKNATLCQCSEGVVVGALYVIRIIALPCGWGCNLY